MKVFKFFCALFIATIMLNSCSNNDSSETPPVTPNTYAMTAKINGVLCEMNNVFGSNASTTTIWDYYPSTEFIRLQGTFGGFGEKEIDIWIKRTDLVVGTHTIGIETYNPAKTHVDLIDNTNSESESTYTGSISITAVNTTSKTVTGTFNFNSANNPGVTSPVANFTVTEGTFNYRYDVQ